MRSLKILVPLLIVGLAGCPEPSDEFGGQPMGDQPPGGQPGGPPNPENNPGDPANPPNPGDPANPSDAAGAPGQPGDPAAAAGGALGSPMPFTPPGLASLAEDGKTVKVSGTVKGEKNAQVDFIRLKEENGQKIPEVLEVVRTTDGTFSVTAPASYSGASLWISVTVDEKGDGPSPDDPGGIAEVPKLQGKDVSVQVDVMPAADLVKKLPWQVPATPTPGSAPVGQPGDPAAPPPGTEPAAPGTDPAPVAPK